MYVKHSINYKFSFFVITCFFVVLGGREKGPKSILIECLMQFACFLCLEGRPRDPGERSVTPLIDLFSGPAGRSGAKLVATLVLFRVSKTTVIFDRFLVSIWSSFGCDFGAKKVSF